MASQSCQLKLLASHVLVAGFASFITYTFIKQHKRCSEDTSSEVGTEEEVEAGWLGHLYHNSKLENVENRYREWRDEKWRSESGWKGSDFIHAKRSKGPRVLRYFFDHDAQMLVGAVKFGIESESHQGLCHGGSMCAVLDDVLGHTAFVCGKGPWSGATIQVNCTLKKPVVIGK